MLSKLKYFLALVLLIKTASISAQQNKKLDSLRSIVTQHASDTIGLRALVDLSELCDEDSIRIYTDAGFKLCNELFSEYPSMQRSLSLFKARLYINEAFFLQSKGDVKNAIRDNMNSIQILEKYNDDHSLAVTLNNIGSLYLDEYNYKKALEYYHKSLFIRKKLGDSVLISNAFSNIGSVYYKTSKWDSALYYYEASQKLISIRTAPSIIGSIFNNIGTVYSKLKEYDTALVYLNKAKRVWYQFDKHRVAVCLANIADVYFFKGDINEAIKTGEEGYKQAHQSGSPSSIAYCSDLLRRAYKKSGNFEKGLFYYEECKKMQDSITNDEAKQALTRAQMQYEYDKRSAIAKIHQEEKDGLAAEEQQQQRIIIYAISSGLFLLLLLSVFILRGYRRKQLSNVEISQQKEIIEEKQKEILDSIRYAKRIQQSLMPTDKYILQKTNALQKPK